LIQVLLNSPVFIILLASGIGVILVGIGVFLIPTNIQSRMDGFIEGAAQETGVKTETGRDQISAVRARINNALSFFSSDELRIKLASAHWQLSDHEYILIRLVGTFLGFILGWLVSGLTLGWQNLGNIFGGTALAVVVYLLPGIILSRSIEVRQQKFQIQLLDSLVLIKGAVQSGYSLLQALDLVRNEMIPPASEEFGRVVREVQLGLPLNQALLNLSARMESDDLYMIVTSIIINNQVGGHLSTMLTAVTETIRARIYLFGEVRALTSYARYAGYFLTFLPFIAGAAIWLLNPSYFDKVPQSLISIGILVLAAIALIIGNIWIRRIVKIKV
jgi:tight adherence protein B